jgi:hypothetical protein
MAQVETATNLELAYQRLLVSRGANPAVKAWAREVMEAIRIPEPEPSPEPPEEQDVVWMLPDPVLDQEDTPHCGGFGGCQWGNLAPVEDHYKNPDGHALYYESVAIGGVPGTEEGVESRWVAKALQARGRLDTYAFARTVDEIVHWVRTAGPVMMGTDWLEEMFEPVDGLVRVNGALMGGHFWVIAGDLPQKKRVLCLNSWGESYGMGGFFEMEYGDLAILLAGVAYPGDAIISPELAL